MRLLIYIGLGVLFPASATQPESDFKVKEQKTRIEMTTPHGLKLYQGNFSLDALKNYKIKIPLSDLIIKPSPAPEASPSPTPTIVAAADTPVDNSCKQVSGCDPKNGCQAPADKRDPASIPDGQPPKPIPRDDEDDDEDDEEPIFDDTGRLLVEANRLYNRKEYYRALALVEDVLRKRPTLTRANVMYGSLLYVLGQKELAREKWADAQKLEPENIWLQDILKRYP